jgi:hypothetical protein
MIPETEAQDDDSIWHFDNVRAIFAALQQAA